MCEDLKKELTEVKEELQSIEGQIEELLERQQFLLDRKDNLTKLIQNTSAKPVSSASTSSSDGGDDSEKKWNKSDFPWSQKLDERRNVIFQIPNYRPHQLETMNATLSGKDCILIMPTGGGKSLCFQLPALVSKGITLVISPLISLMEDQLMTLHIVGIKATLLNAASSKEDVKEVHDAMATKTPKLKLLYVTPEKIAKSKRFMNRLEKMYEMGNFARIVIDEVHCCSQWGHDFRPDYKILGILKRQFPGVPILGLTATATTKVIQDVTKLLNIPQCLVLKASFNRPNLYYEVRVKSSNLKDNLDEISKVILTRFQGEAGIVYCFSQKDTEEITRGLQDRGIPAGCYHANISAARRTTVHRDWMQNKIQVIVATIAFGMGIDKPDVRFVIHHSISKSMENFYQESGRAGRDDNRAYCILFFRFGDIFRQSTMVFVERTGLDNLYGMLGYCLDTGRCRRSIIAQHFGEAWDSLQCNGMCDHCDASRTVHVELVDITSYCKDIFTILTEAGRTNQKVTGLKLVEAWLGKGVASLRVKTIQVPGLSREDCERVITYMIVEGYLKEVFHYTAYTTYSYLEPGPKANMVIKFDKKVSLNFERKARKEKTKPVAINSEKSAFVSNPVPSQSFNKPAIKSSSKKDKIKPVIINSEKSAFAAHPIISEDGSQPSAKKKQDKPSVKKRKPVVLSDSDDELDLDDDVYLPHSKKQKVTTKKFRDMDSVSSSLSKNSTVDGTISGSMEPPVVVLDDDSEDCSDWTSPAGPAAAAIANSTPLPDKESLRTKKKRKTPSVLTSEGAGNNSSADRKMKNLSSSGNNCDVSHTESCNSSGAQNSSSEFVELHSMYTSQLSAIDHHVGEKSSPDTSYSFASGGQPSFENSPQGNVSVVKRGDKKEKSSKLKLHKQSKLSKPDFQDNASCDGDEMETLEKVYSEQLEKIEKGEK
ncbi:ATP-dependent DNA helicase Q1 [Lingula anatina]|uniref:ATP-dependent DNA helicase n=1 Tax=Lingula anatina TaxID=7574 RepID=A0A1S3JPX4_LINAN|nr:ATP-dependent DNA helicase Q1 [Lingula anatina]XP_013412025.1 ATP-dependent DNA helicase Q1 [Lingula anatina]XP_013412027.1 ATP-dependent DNA helicase Q1 [Lingula anatina]XP_013412028.1 ATP-dependent DNA helicase Q1 [Lingula anatina]XP_013412029.1 ATP-dependent DNA helicase Q1 [Lingula anatina]|eukprot:XP_013412024.1 ATP-dependent DNA helicase Q1 [Lingula anatina]